MESDSLCRSIALSEDATSSTLNGLAVCTERAKPAKFYSRYGYTGCGYAIDTKTSLRSLEVYRIRWADASAQGFCVFPLQRTTYLVLSKRINDEDV